MLLVVRVLAEMLVGSTAGFGETLVVVVLSWFDDMVTVFVVVWPLGFSVMVSVDTRTVGLYTVTVFPSPVTVVDLAPLVFVTVLRVVVIVCVP